ncbi:MAG: DNA repair protein RecN [Bacteroidales bacterium]|nr:DNA repair protein RecN [Bacteroidales bacterium]
MLQHLNISNYALIEKSDIEFDEGMSVITGETGAGKSIMLGALGLLLGGRADVQVLQNKDQKCIVEATFDVAKYGLNALFEEEEVDYDDETIIRREILPNGKSRAFVNDQPVNVSFLKLLGNKLIDIHSQHQNLLLSDGSFHLNIVDTVAQDDAERLEYRGLYDQYVSLQARERSMVEDNERMKRDLDYMEFQLRELQDLKLVEDEDKELEIEQERLSNAEDIKMQLSESINLMEGNEQSIIPALKQLSNSVTKIDRFLPNDTDAANRITSARIDIEDLLRTFSGVYDSLEVDPQRLEYVDSRLNAIYNLEKKHRVESVNDLIKLRDDLSEKVGHIANFDEQLDLLREEIEKVLSNLTVVADKLSEKRQSVFADIQKYVESHLHDMGMRNAVFTIGHKRSEVYTATGNDELHFLFAANLGGVPTDISKVASGGEMSRVMLSIKSLLSRSKSLPTIIFDEIDTGVSGDVADKMGSIMNKMADNMQVIAITHLPQVAAKGGRHYQVYKEDTAESTVSHIRALSSDDRVTEIAKMLSGSRVSDAAIQNAKELLSAE